MREEQRFDPFPVGFTCGCCEVVVGSSMINYVCDQCLTELNGLKARVAELEKQLAESGGD